MKESLIDPLFSLIGPPYTTEIDIDFFRDILVKLRDFFDSYDYFASFSSGVL